MIALTLSPHMTQLSPRLAFPSTPVTGQLITRYKRFLADIDLTGEIITAHCANPGSMKGLLINAAPVWVTRATNAKRKLKYDWQVVELAGATVCVNTSLANKIVKLALEAQTLPPFSSYHDIRQEVPYAENSRIDFLLKGTPKPDVYVEVKNVTLSRRVNHAEFPDSPTARGTKHLKALSLMADQGHQACMFYLVNRTDCQTFSIASDIDPLYAQAFEAAQKAGVHMMAYGTDITPQGICINRSLKILA